jgi:hypothetical protein
VVRKDQVQCSAPEETQQVKLVKIARALNAYAVGDDGEHYELRKNPSGEEELVTVEPEV